VESLLFHTLPLLLNARLHFRCDVARAAGACPGTGTQQGLASLALHVARRQAQHDEVTWVNRARAAGPAGNLHITFLHGSGCFPAAFVPPHSAVLAPSTRGLWREKNK